MSRKLENIRDSSHLALNYPDRNIGAMLKLYWKILEISLYC